MITHIAAPHVTIDDRYLRQRCAWCGAILLDYDLHRVAVPAGQEGPPGTWPAGALVTVDGGASWTADGEQLPDNACAKPTKTDPWAALDETIAGILGANLERYCLDSGRPVSLIPGDRCRAHSDAYTPCTTDVRPARCEHPHLSPNHPTPHCSECGKDVTP